MITGLLSRRDARMKGRPALYTEYRADQALMNTPGKRWWTAGLVLLVLAGPWLLNARWLLVGTLIAIFAIGAIGQNIISGYAGQVSLGHAFFVGVGAYTAAILGTEETSRYIGFNLEMWIWLPIAGIVPAILGFLVAPLAARVRGLYLAILTLGLVFVGEHLFDEVNFLFGVSGSGRPGPTATIAGVNLRQPQTLFGMEFARNALFYLFCVVLLVVMAVLARNLVRSKQGRAFAAVRDRDIAAEIMGVSLLRTKTLAFVVSSFYAGICGALFVTWVGRARATQFDLLLSVEFLAMVLIGGVATISGAIIGAIFVKLLPEVIQDMSGVIPGLSTEGTDGFLSVFQLNAIIFGLMIVLFLVLEPRGIYGIWIRIRNYFKAWPFSY